MDKRYAVAEKYGLLTMVDDAHGEGVLGHGGRGIVDHFGLHGNFDVESGTFSKAFGVVGGVIAGKKVIVDYLRQKARSFLFSNAVTAADSAACLAAGEVLSESTELVDRLWQNTELFKDGMQQLGFNVDHSVPPITPKTIWTSARRNSSGSARSWASSRSKRSGGLDVYSSAISGACQHEGFPRSLENYNAP